ncbi:MAG: hypothetical protein ABJF11_09380 [Reichenbachiella sp.]|uniref:hypothetical protein n=1 Tax=Reichenbachiella sp. TaxID=2184521 RepID=UPI003265A208
MNSLTKVAINTYVFLAIFSQAIAEAPNSALAYQQTTNSRILIESNIIRFYTGGVERMIVDNNGNIGIGTTAPSNTLSVKSDIIGKDAFNIFNSEDVEIFEFGTLNNNQSYFKVNDKDGNVGMLYRTDSDEFYVLGKVGIGASSPTAQLSITSTGTIGEGNFENSSIYMTDGSMELGIDPNQIYSGQNLVLNADSYLGFKSGNEERVRILENGNVGIGNSNPGTYKLKVSGTGYFTDDLTVYKKDIILIDKNNGTADGLGIKFIDNARMALYADAEIQFRESDSDATQIIMNLNDGRLGIGTISPQYPLHVSGTAYATKFRAPSNAVWPDYVFSDKYVLNSLERVENYIEKNHHLPDVPSAAEVEANGVDLVDMQALLLKKIEELTLYLIEKDNEVRQLNNRLQTIENLIKEK